MLHHKHAKIRAISCFVPLDIPHDNTAGSHHEQKHNIKLHIDSLKGSMSHSTTQCLYERYREDYKTFGFNIHDVYCGNTTHAVFQG